MKLVTIIGARPQFIKTAMINRALMQQEDISEVVIHTGQHYDNKMSDIFFSELGIPSPKYNLGIGGGLHGAMTGAQLAGIEEVLILEKPDCVIVFGDTNSTMAGALAASKLHIPIAHVEAGLRSFNRKMPEELNRVVTDHLSDLLFAPTDAAIKNLSNEGIAENKCHNVGDIMLDAALFYGDLAHKRSEILNLLGLSKNRYALVTVHREENTSNPSILEEIISSFNKVSQSLTVIWPIHPGTLQLIHKYSLKRKLGENVRLIDPVGYLDMIMLEKNAAVIATDSGGIQKEAFFHKVPCVTLREETEWFELVDAGWNYLSPPLISHDISKNILTAIGGIGKDISPYGVGNSSHRIISALVNYL